MSRGFIRIIGGEWRGRKIQVPEEKDLRPTPDRVRETVFNWLAPVIRGAYCLDAFAGTGALGFEALSRGAAHVVMVDASLRVTKTLHETAEMLKTTDAEIHCGQAPAQLPIPAKPFDIVFLDPPYQSQLLLPCCFYLEENHLLASEAYIYLESRETVEQKSLPHGWKLMKSKRAGDVGYHLAVRKI